MTGPSSSPRGERAGTPGATWETELARVEQVIADDDKGQQIVPTPNRATRRAIKRATRRKK